MSLNDCYQSWSTLTRQYNSTAILVPGAKMLHILQPEPENEPRIRYILTCMIAESMPRVCNPNNLIKYFSPFADAMSPQPSHIDTLPNELLADIFELNHDHSNPYTSLPPEVLSSHVSRRWRDVAISFPTLWARIHIDIRSSLLWLPHYLSRSQSCHLDVEIDHGYSGLENRANITYMMNLLIPHVGRWSRLDVSGWYEYPNYLVLSHLDNLRAPVLRKLSVYFEEGAGSIEGNSIPLEILQGGAPLLTSVSLDNLQRCWPPVSALTTCAIDRCQISVAWMRFIQTLASSHALTTLAVDGTITQGRDPPQEIEPWPYGRPERTQLDSLKSFGLYCTANHTSTLLLAISAPRLETLSLGYTEDDDLDMLFNSPRRSWVRFPALHTLSLDFATLSNNSYIQLSRMFPSITHLKLTSIYPIDFQDLAELIGSPDTSDGRRATVIWPKLHTIMVGYLQHRSPRAESDPLGNVFCNLLAARRALGRPIGRLVLEKHVFEMVEGTDGLGEYLELWECPSMR